MKNTCENCDEFNPGSGTTNPSYCRYKVRRFWALPEEERRESPENSHTEPTDTCSHFIPKGQRNLFGSASRNPY